MTKLPRKKKVKAKKPPVHKPSNAEKRIMAFINSGQYLNITGLGMDATDSGFKAELCLVDMDNITATGRSQEQALLALEKKLVNHYGDGYNSNCKI